MKALFLALFMFATQAYAAEEIFYDGPAEWNAFEKYMEKRHHDDQVEGLSYLISGAVATAGGVVGYYSSEDSLSRGLYAIAQSVGVAAMGYGATFYFIGNEYNSFYRAVDQSHLTGQQKTEILRRFLQQEKEEAERRKWIKVATHSLIAGMNFYSAHREQDRDVKGILNFLGAINAAVALTYAF